MKFSKSVRERALLTQHQSRYMKNVKALMSFGHSLCVTLNTTKSVQGNNFALLVGYKARRRGKKMRAFAF